MTNPAIGAATALLLLAASSECVAAEPSTQACSAAIHVVTETMSRATREQAWVVDDPLYLTKEEVEASASDPGFATLTSPTPDDLRRLWRGSRPSRGLEAMPPPPVEQRITECTSLRAAFNGGSVEFGRAAHDRRDAMLERDEPAPDVVAVGTPKVSADGMTATVYVSASSGGSGRVDILHLKRTKAGAWRTIGRLQIAIG